MPPPRAPQPPSSHISASHPQNSPPHPAFPKARSAPGGTLAPPGSARYTTAARRPPPHQMIRWRHAWATKRAKWRSRA
ncbi:hypothetical protein C8R44DRAFT_764967 [Mycena epipterygia]|nr:hypothetical protein C8R44DRAFT_764967 [Mycena epipterygia]